METTGELAARLGTSVPRILRAIAALGLEPPRTPGGHVRLRGGDARRLTEWLGSAPSLPGLSREAVFVLAALARHPLGLVSARAVARAAGTSPTTASHELARLRQAGLVERAECRVVEGRVRTISTWRVRYASPQWRAVARQVARTLLPRQQGAATTARVVPARLHHLFWDVPRPGDLDVQAHGAAIAHRLLTSNDPQALAWASKYVGRDALRGAARVRGTDPAVVAMARNLAG